MCWSVAHIKLLTLQDLNNSKYVPSVHPSWINSQVLTKKISQKTAQSSLEKWFLWQISAWLLLLKVNVHIKHTGILLKWGFWAECPRGSDSISLEQDLELCIFDRPPGDSETNALQTYLSALCDAYEICPPLLFFFFFPLLITRRRQKTFFPPVVFPLLTLLSLLKKQANLRNCFLSSISVFSHIHFFSIIKCQFFFSDIFFSSLPVRLFFSCNFHTPPWFFFSCYQKFIISLIKQFIKLIWILNSPQRITDSYSECIYK